MAPIRRVMASSLGKMPTTVVRRLSSPDGKIIRKYLFSYFILRGAFGPDTERLFDGLEE